MKYQWSRNDVILVQDGKPKWKYELYPDYKKREKIELPGLLSIPVQFKITRLVLSFMGLTQAWDKDNEGDDVIYSLSKKYPDEEVFVVGNDHDFKQCLSENVKLMILTNQGEPIYTEKNFIDEYGVVPDDYWKIQTLAGCPTDKVPGMKGIGEKTATKIVQSNSFNKITNNAHDLVFPTKASKTKFNNIFKDWNMLRDAKLVKLRSKTNHIINRYNFNEEKVREWFVKLAFKHYLEPSNFLKIIKAFSK